MYLEIFFSIICFSLSLCSVNLNFTKVYGPGLYPDKIVLPVRYFFIETRDSSNNQLNVSAKGEFKVQVEGESASGTYCRVWTQVLDRYDGTYIVRYKNYHTCTSTYIHVLYDHQHVAQSPYFIEGPFYSEDCYCPLENIDTWLQSANCPEKYDGITDDLRPFPKVDMNPIIKQVEKRFNQPGARSLCNYVIKKNEVYRKCYGQHVGFNMFMDNVLHSMARKMILPDIEFIVNLGDWPLVEYDMKPLLPIFSWCGSDETADIVMPTYDLTEATLEMMGRVMLDMLSVQSNNEIPWEKKKPKAFWRGRDSRQERLDLVTLSREHPDLFNVSLTNFFFFKDQESKYGPKEKHISFFKFFDYKYQISIDGTVAAYRFPYLLGGNGVVFKQESPYYEFFYRDLVPGVHYIPFKRDLSDLVEKIQWALSNDEDALKTSLNSRQFANENLLPQHVFCYQASLFKEWAKRLHSKVHVRPGMEFVPNQENVKRFGNCNCDRLQVHDEF